jgi:hypothetical protein
MLIKIYFVFLLALYAFAMFTHIYDGFVRTEDSIREKISKRITVEDYLWIYRLSSVIIFFIVLIGVLVLALG